MLQKVILSFCILACTFVGLAFSLSNITVKGRPLWCYLNKTVVIKGGQAYKMTNELAVFKEDASTHLVLGSSHAYRGYDPEYFSKQNISIFNAGSSAQSLSCTFRLLKYYSPKFNKVILDVYPGSVCRNTNESTINLMQNTPDHKLAFGLFKQSLNIFVFNNFIYRLLRLNEEPLYNEDGYIERGYVKTNEILNSKVRVPVYDFDEKEWSLLEDIIKYCVLKKIELVLVSHPLPKPLGKDNGYWYFKHRISKICGDYNISFYDYTYKFDLDNTFFKDYNHLNSKGVGLFNKQLIKDKFGKEQWN